MRGTPLELRGDVHGTDFGPWSIIAAPGGRLVILTLVMLSGMALSLARSDA
jgi:hypothetical protein